MDELRLKMAVVKKIRAVRGGPMPVESLRVESFAKSNDCGAQFRTGSKTRRIVLDETPRATAQGSVPSYERKEHVNL